jgi:2,4-dienoyl-CoA reductase-like NADH-dependent reductase (Old Yellow Enzyme family)
MRVSGCALYLRTNEPRPVSSLRPTTTHWDASKIVVMTDAALNGLRGETTPMNHLFSPLALPNGTVLANRIAKAAMEEHLGTLGQLPDQRIAEAYRAWGAGGAGLLITGNVMVDARALTSPRGIVLDRHSDLGPFRDWASAAKSGGAAVWMQLSHPGRQVYSNMPGVKLAPSRVAVDVGKQSKRFAMPHAMSQSDVAEVIDMFVTSAARAYAAGFDGVEVHAAHGYLLSQFLSPLTNVREDQWGGSLDNRARIVLEVVRGIRSQVPHTFSVAVKLNSADFQRGGFDVSDAKSVVEMLNAEAVDLIEVSGGTYESPAMQGRRPKDERTLAREAYFLEFAQDIKRVAAVPVMVTGGIRRRDTAEYVVASGVDVVGIATAFTITPDLPDRWRRGESASAAVRPVEWKDKALASAGLQALVRYQIHRLGLGKNPRPAICARYAFVRDQVRQRTALPRYRAWLAARESLATAGVSHP